MYFLQPVGYALIIIGLLWFLYERQKNGGSVSSTGNLKSLGSYASDLTAAAQSGAIDPVVGRAEEIKRVTQILTRRTKNNVVLVGPPGVGKTAIVEGLAERIAAGEVPAVLLNKRVLSLRVAEVLAGTKYRGEFEERVKHIIEDIRRGERTIILFIDEIHTIMQSRGTEGAVHLSDILKPALSRGDLQLIGATTEKEYVEYIASDESWERRFQKVIVDEPTMVESVAILNGIKSKYEEYHGVRFTDEAVKAAVRLSEEYIKHRQLPDKAIDLIDEAAAMVTVEAEGKHPEHAAGILHSAAGVSVNRRPNPDSVPLTPPIVVDVLDIKKIVAEWIGVEVDEIH